MTIFALLLICCFEALSVCAPTHQSHHQIHQSASDKVHDCSQLSRLPIEIHRNIFDRLDASTAASMSQANAYYHELCQPVVNAKFPIGKTPTFIPAVKRCLLSDDLDCYKVVLKHFKKIGLVMKHHLAQIPALAAQLGATNIFHSLGKNSSHPLWNHWMTRAVIQQRYEFLKQVAGRDRPDDWKPSDFPRPLEFYDKMALNYAFYERPNGYSLSKLFKNCWRIVFNLESFYRDWTVRSMADDQEQNCPTPRDVFNAIEIQDMGERSKAIDHLKERITHVLAQGVYTIDDVMLDPFNMHKLLWFHVTTQPHDSDDEVYEFVMWLLGEGSPITDVNLLENFELLCPKRLDTTRYKKLLRISVDYTSGSATSSLVDQLRIAAGNSFHSNPYKFVGLLSKYKTLLRADVSHPLVLKNAKLLLEEMRGDWFLAKGFRIIDEFFKEQGHGLNELEIVDDRIHKKQS